MSIDWWFRPEPADRAREFGNANIWTFRPDLETFVREVGQNTLDVRVATTVELHFRLIQLAGDDLVDFLDALNWDTKLRPHLEASVASGQKLGRSLAEGLRQLQETKSVTLLRIEERGALGLIGDEFGSNSNFAGLCRNNLDSNKKSSTAGGAFGLGKAVLWRTSLLSTVLFNSDIDDPEFPEKDDRLIGRTELSWHEVDGGAYAGPGWFGELAEDTAISVWGNGDIASRLCLNRPDDSTGTSIVVVGFHDPAVDDEPTVADLAERLAHGAARNFWPAIESGRLAVVVETATGRTDSSVNSTSVVDAEVWEPDLVRALRCHRENTVVDALLNAGDTVRLAAQLELPRKKDGSQAPAEHETVVLVRRAAPDAPDVGTCVFYRGTEMIVERKDLRGVRVGAMPFHAVVLCGESAGDDSSALIAEEFLRIAEPPAHNTWELTPDLKYTYAQGGGAAIGRLFTRVRTAVRDVVAPVTEDLSDGPQKLKELFRMRLPADPKPRQPEIHAVGEVNAQGAWVLAARVRVHDTSTGWRMNPVVVFDAETGGGSRVKWAELTAEKNCTVVGNAITVAPGVRELRFRGVTNPESHPVPARASAVTVELRNTERVGA